MKKKFCSMTILFTIYVFPIILADRYYQDDLSRSLRGITGWSNDARPLTEFLMRWLGGGTPISDISPFPLLLSVILLAYTLTLYVHNNHHLLFLQSAQIHSTNMQAETPSGSLPSAQGFGIAVCLGFPVIANPFLLSTFSYRFDCITMILALCAAILPYAMPDAFARWKIFLASAFLCMVVLTTYQPCIGIYISLCFMELFFMILQGRVDWKRLVIRALSLIVCLPPYYLVMRHFITEGSWQESAYQFSGGDSLFSSIPQNFSTLARFVRRYFDGVPRYVIVLTSLLVVCGMILTVLRVWSSSNTKKPVQVLHTLYILCLPVFVTLSSLLPLLVLAPSKFSVSSHTLIALCSFGLWMGVMLLLSADRFPNAVMILMIPFLVFHMGFSYTYGNAMKEQKNYEEYVTYSIVHDIETLEGETEYQYLTINGHAPKAPEVQMLCEKYPIFSSLVPTYVTSNSYLGGALLQHYMQQDLEFEGMTEENETLTQSGNAVISNSLYDCYTDGDKIIIQFREASNAF
jgi:hypothetical protein